MAGKEDDLLQYINAGLPNAHPQVDPLYNLLTPHGLQQGWGYFYNYIYGKLNAKFTSNVNPALYYYGVESTNYGHACSLAHFAGVLGTAAAASAAPPATSGTYLILPPPPKPSQPGAYEDFCWYLGGFFAYMGIMAIPLGTAGAAFPPLGIGLGMALAFAASFAWGFC